MTGEPMAEIDVVEDEVELPDCPRCEGPGTYLGTLGSKVWLRCRNCGWEYRA